MMPPLLGVLVQDILGVCAANGYMIVWDEKQYSLEF